MKALLIATAVLYGAVALFTYGHAYVGIEQRECAQGYCSTADIGAAYGGALSAAFWPFYWSVQAARKRTQ